MSFEKLLLENYYKNCIKKNLNEGMETQTVAPDNRSSITQGNYQQNQFGNYNINIPKLDIQQQTNQNEEDEDIGYRPNWNPDILNGAPTYLDSEGRPVWVTQDSDGQIVIIVEVSPGVFYVYHESGPGFYYGQPNYYNPETGEEVIPSSTPEGYDWQDIFPNWNPATGKPPPGGEPAGGYPNWYEDIINDAIQGHHPLDWRFPQNPGRWDWNWYINQPNFSNM